MRKQSCGNLEQNARRQNDSHQEDGGEMLIAIVLDKPLSEAQALVDDPDAFMLEITKIIQNKHAHPVIAQMLHPDVRDDLPFRMCPCLIRRPKQSHCNDESRAAANAISISAYICSAVNVGYPRLMVQHPALFYRSGIPVWLCCRWIPLTTLVVCFP